MNERLASYDPSNGELLGDVQVTTKERLSVMVAQAQSAAVHWRKLDAVERVTILEKAYARLEPHQNGLYPLPEGGWHPPWHGQLGAAHAHSGTAGNHFIRNCETEKNGKYALMAS